MNTYTLTIKEGRKIIMKLYIEACMEVEAKNEMLKYISEEVYNKIESRTYKLTITTK